jgi:general secretion pathway protein D
VFGSLFRYDTRSRQKTNLMIFLKPTIVRSTNEGREITSERYDYLRGEQARNAPGERWFWNDPTIPVLPPQGALPGSAQGTAIGIPIAPPNAPFGLPVLPAPAAGNAPPTPAVPPPAK